jgi:hypothetical protein
MNTTLIITLQTNDNQAGNFAAKVCADYSVTANVLAIPAFLTNLRVSVIYL